MSLNWSITNVADWQKKQEEDNGTLECLIWATLSIGMGDLNEKTVKEFCYRLNRFSNEVEALALQDDQTALVWTVEMLETWFGLHTNVSPVSNAGFDKHLRKLTNREK